MGKSCHPSNTDMFEMSYDTSDDVNEGVLRLDRLTFSESELKDCPQDCFSPMTSYLKWYVVYNTGHPCLYIRNTEQTMLLNNSR
jgi:hypothetical protein